MEESSSPSYIDKNYHLMLYKILLLMYYDDVFLLLVVQRIVCELIARIC